MKTRLLVAGLAFSWLLFSCNAEKRAEAERKKQEQLKKLDADKQQFEQKTN